MVVLVYVNLEVIQNKNTTDSKKVKFWVGYLLTCAVYTIEAVINQS